MDRAIIEDGAEIHDSIIGRHVTVKSRLSEKTTIQDVSVVADDVTRSDAN